MHDPLEGEAGDKARILIDVLARWTARINLVAASTVATAWERHVLDSAQVWPFVRDGELVADLGSGGGFPGLVVAALVSAHGGPDVHLVEADQRKAAFLRTAAREMDVAATVHAARVEALAPLSADRVTARALAPLPKLLSLGSRHLAPGGRFVFLKGATESTSAPDCWTVKRHPSRVSDGCILEITHA